MSSKSLIKAIEEEIYKKYKTLADFAYDSGISYQNLQNWKRRNSEPDLKSLAIICNKLDIDINYLLGITSTNNKITNLEVENKNLKTENENLKKENEKLLKKNMDLYEEITEINRDMRKYHTDYYEKKTH